MELIRPDFIKADLDAQLQRGPEVQRPPAQQSCFGILSGIELVERAMVTPTTFVWSIRTKTGIAQLLAPQGPMNEESQGGLFGPLPARQFGSPVSWKLASRASMAAFTATA